ncbi:MAG: hypothetical protein WA581_16655 [Candidatus Acidiferrales bacterium]
MSTQTRMANANPAIVPVEGPVDSTRTSVGGAGTADTATDRFAGGTAVQTGANPYGTNNEQLPERMQEALRRLGARRRPDQRAGTIQYALESSDRNIRVRDRAEPDEFADNHAVELEICMQWFSADAGQVAKIEAPAGCANVCGHAMFHREYILKQEREAQR